jgi:hydroxyacylglutathione hydrolase
MLQIQQFRYAADNLGYLIFGHQSAIAVDGGAVDEIITFVHGHNLSLTYVTNTHGHSDHTLGNASLISAMGATYLSPEMSAEREYLKIDNDVLRVLRTPGHSADSVVFQAGGMILSGDTLFNGTIGNCFSSKYFKSFFASLQTLTGLPPQTIVYAGHDYVKESMVFARRIEPDNPDISIYINRYSPDHVCSTLGEELRVNPYLRYDSPAIIAHLKSRNLPVKTEYERWESLMSIE